MARSVGSRVLVALALVAVGAGGYWAGSTALREEPAVATAPDASITAEVVEQELGRSITLTTTVTRTSVPVALNHVSGVITFVTEVDEAAQGGILYTAGATPVRAIAGVTPFWRDLAVNTTGSDVSQLRGALADLGYLADGSGDRFTQGVQTAVRNWQRDLGQPVTGRVALGELVAFPSLPAPISIDRAVFRPGAELAGGEAVVAAAAGLPVFEMIVNSRQVELIPDGAQVVVHGEGVSWNGVAGEIREEDGLFHITVTGPVGEALCGETCTELPATGQVNLLTDIIVVPAVHGPVVPVSAVTTMADGTAEVTVVHADRDEARRVDLVTSVDGLAVVSGLEVGETVRVFGPEP